MSKDQEGRELILETVKQLSTLVDIVTKQADIIEGLDRRIRILESHTHHLYTGDE